MRHLNQLPNQDHLILMTWSLSREDLAVKTFGLSIAIFPVAKTEENIFVYGVSLSRALTDERDWQVILFVWHGAATLTLRNYSVKDTMHRGGDGKLIVQYCSLFFFEKLK